VSAIGFDAPQTVVAGHAYPDVHGFGAQCPFIAQISSAEQVVFVQAGVQRLGGSPQPVGVT
jgi:hypothetical protein